MEAAMRVIGALIALLAFSNSAYAIGFQLCNRHGVDPAVTVTAWDRKAGNAMIFNRSVPKNQCMGANASGGATGDHAEISLKVGSGSPYGVPWIKQGDQVNF
jgi:hypothetical protein